MNNVRANEFSLNVKIKRAKPEEGKPKDKESMTSPNFVNSIFVMREIGSAGVKAGAVAIIVTVFLILRLLFPLRSVCEASKLQQQEIKLKDTFLQKKRQRSI
jgi:hypothetical protein